MNFKPIYNCGECGCAGSGDMPSNFATPSNTIGMGGIEPMNTDPLYTNISKRSIFRRKRGRRFLIPLSVWLKKRKSLRHI